MCVSALRAIVVPSTNDTMPALPTNADRTNGRVDGGSGGAQLIEQRRELDPIRAQRRAERLVRAVLAPRLGDRLQLDVGRVASERLEVVADGDQLGRIEGQGALVAEPGEAAGVEAAHGDRLHAAGGVLAGVEVGIGEGVASSAR